MIVFTGIFAAILVYKTASIFYGGRAGLFALFIFCFTPEIIAHSSLATTDMTFTCFFLLAIFSFWHFSKNPAPKNVLLASLCLGLAQLTKYTALLLYPAFFLLVIIECADKRLKGNKLFPKTVIIFLLSVIVIWAGYGFSVKSFLAQAGNREKKIDFTQKTLNRFIPGWDRQKTEHLLKDIKFPLTTYITGIFGVAEHTKEGHNSFFLGKWSQYGNRWYYIVAFLVKTPLPILAMLCI
jgi:4-amino-4-deoxy-L-arabinose transferase-like glycosyltransferase